MLIWGRMDSGTATYFRLDGDGGSPPPDDGDGTVRGVHPVYVVRRFWPRQAPHRRRQGRELDDVRDVHKGRR